MIRLKMKKKKKIKNPEIQFKKFYLKQKSIKNICLKVLKRYLEDNQLRALQYRKKKEGKIVMLIQFFFIFK